MSHWRLAALAAAAVASMAGTAHAGQCRDPWITQAIREVTGHDPYGNYETGDCTYTQYGGGHWNSYPELRGYVQQRWGNSFAISRGSVPSMSRSQFNALPKWSGNGQTYAYYNGQWMRLITDNGGGLKLIGQDSAGIAIDNGAN